MLTTLVGDIMIVLGGYDCVEVYGVMMIVLASLLLLLTTSECLSHTKISLKLHKNTKNNDLEKFIKCLYLENFNKCLCCPRL